MVNFVLASTELFSLSITVPELRRNVYSSALFHRGRPLCIQLLSGQGRAQPSLAPENQRHCATRWQRPHSSTFPRFDRIPERDRQTDMPPIA